MFVPVGQYLFLSTNFLALSLPVSVLLAWTMPVGRVVSVDWPVPVSLPLPLLSLDILTESVRRRKKCCVTVSIKSYNR